jgi:hypothetical protein
LKNRNIISKLIEDLILNSSKLYNVKVKEEEEEVLE